MKARIYRPDDILTFGKYRGLTLRQLIEDKDSQDPTYIQWAIEHVSEFCLHEELVKYCLKKGIIDGEDARMNNFKRRRSKKEGTLSSVLEAVFNDIEKGDQSSKEPIKTGFTEFDTLFDGLEPGSLTVIGGRPCIGKTALITTLLYNISILRDIPSYFLTNELPHFLGQRLLSYATGIGRTELAHSSRLRKEDIQRLKENTQIISKAPILLDDYSVFDNKLIISQCLKFHATRGVRVVFLDIISEAHTYDYTEDYYCKRCRQLLIDLKKMAKDYNMAVVCTIPLCRTMELRGGDLRPMTHDMGYLDNLTYVFDKILLLYRPEYYHIDIANKSLGAGYTELIVARNTMGQLGTAHLRLQHEWAKFEDWPS